MNSKNYYLDMAWNLYKTCSHQTTLGMCVRNVCPTMQTSEHRVLSKLDGHCALEYFNDHFNQESNQGE